MKILKLGTPPAERVYRVTCDQCKSELEFLEKEAKFNFDQRDGNFLSLNCPVCEGRITYSVK